MAKHIYHNNDVEILLEEEDQHEGKVNVNGENLIWISLQDASDFKRDLSEVLDRYRI